MRRDWWRRSEAVLVRAVVACLGSLVLALVLVLVAAFWFVFALASPLESPGLFVVAPFAVMMGGLAASSLASTSVVPAVWATRVRVRRHEEAVAQHTGRAPRLPDSDLEVEWLLTGSRFVGFFFTAVHTGDERGIDPETARRLPRRPERWLAPVRAFRAPLPSRVFDLVRTSAPRGTWLAVLLAGFAETGLRALAAWAAGVPL
ncbi:hypothetical protein [Frigoribacterium faeni]|uniref:hypothetical protein n=1 Tax=Frigoribacterium faeni TaxID=145483 RepID=UPI00141B10DF|nr:hypothetical protein [Frigoribacterium faeni]NIJ05215.1 hypothetical protein [Frigoribacterium faeni]